MEILKKLQINIQFAEAIFQMPKYVKFLKELNSSKKNLQEFETITLNKKCSAIVLSKLPLKCRHPGSLTIPSSVGNLNFLKALCDLGTSINLMSLSVYRILGLGKTRSTNICL